MQRKGQTTSDISESVTNIQKCLGEDEGWRGKRGAGKREGEKGRSRGKRGGGEIPSPPCLTSQLVDKFLLMFRYDLWIT